MSAGESLIARGERLLIEAAPDPRLRAVVVVPARDEQERIGACLKALARQRGVVPSAFEVILVLDHCRDDTRARALRAAAVHPALSLIVRESAATGCGARAAGRNGPRLRAPARRRVVPTA